MLPLHNGISIGTPQSSSVIIPGDFATAYTSPQSSGHISHSEECLMHPGTLSILPSVGVLFQSPFLSPSDVFSDNVTNYFSSQVTDHFNQSEGGIVVARATTPYVAESAFLSSPLAAHSSPMPGIQ